MQGLQIEEEHVPLLETLPPQQRHTEVTITVRNLSFKVKQKSKPPKEILHNLTVSFPPGTMTALMGPSGAGKTTLLDMLTGQTHRGIKTGFVGLNGLPISKDLKRLFCFVPQDDVMLAGLTPRETLTYVARLRLPSTLSKAEIADRVSHLLDKLMLTKCADTRIGNVDLRGISGGERKRVSIGMELLTDPSVMFLDEPTSGLDSKMAKDIVRLLRQLCQDSRTIVCTIHQPSFGIFSLFDRLVMLSQGRVCYVGPTLASTNFLSSCGFALQAQENPAELWMELLQDPSHVVTLTNGWERSNEAQDQVAQAGAMGGFNSIEDEGHKYAISRLSMFVLLTRRALTDHFKDPQKYIGSLVVKLTVGLMVGVIWLNQAKKHKQESIFTTQGVLFLVCLNSCMDTMMQTALLLPVFRSLLIREYRNGYYALPPYYASMGVCHSIAQCLNALVLAVPVYFMVGLRLELDSFFIFTSTLCCLAIIGVLVGMLVGAVANDFQQAQQVIAPAIVPLVLFSGYVIPYSQIPVYFRWLYHVSFFQYALATLQINQFQHITFDDCPPPLPPLPSQQCTASCIDCVDCAKLNLFNCFATGSDYLHSVHVNPDNLARNFYIMGACAVVVAVIGYYVTRRVVRTH